MPSESAPPVSNLQMGGREWLLLTGLAALWGCSFLFFKVLAQTLPPFTIVLGRVGVAAVALNIAMLILKRPLPRDPRIWGGLALVGLMNNVTSFSLTAYGIRYIPSGLASILNASTPIFTVLAAHFVTVDDKLSGRRAIGVIAGFVGVAVLMGPSAFGHQNGQALIGEACSVLGAVLAAIASVYGRRLAKIPPMTAATCQLTASTLIVLPLALIFEHPWTLPPQGWEVWGSILGISLLSTALAFLLFFRILHSAGATNLQLVTFLIPVFAITLGSILLGERLPPRAFVGMGIIALGLAFIDGRPLRWLRRLT
jgi:drug/metabolite transporter (DMT)-like permease